MPGSTASNFQYKRNMEKILTQKDYQSPTQLFVALMITVPNAAGANGQEVNGGGYQRKAIPCDVDNWQESGTTWSNKKEVVFDVPSANWGTVTGACLFDAATGGNMIYYATLTTSKTISNGDGAPRILANQLQINRATCP